MIHLVKKVGVIALILFSVFQVQAQEIYPGKATKVEEDISAVFLEIFSIN